MNEPTAAQERAGEVGTELASNLAAKVTEAIDGFPVATPDQRSAIAGLIGEALEDYADKRLRT